MRKRVLVVCSALSLAACTSNPIPEGYTGPLAYVTDSVSPRSGTSADFFFLSKIDGRTISDSTAATRAANYGRGFSLSPTTIGRNLPAAPATFTLVGRTEYGAPILALLNPSREVGGDIKFTPLPDRSYRVRGILGEGYSAVWIEDYQTGAIVSDKIEHGTPPAAAAK
jgi:hypothetical protein